MKNRKILVFSLLLAAFCLNISFAADINCDVCGMKIEQKGRNHMLLKHDEADKKTLNVCSIPCLLKARKHDSQYTKVEMINFNNPEKFLAGDKAFFLVKSKKIKADLGDMVMPPHIVALSTKKETDAVLKKYDDGTIVQGFENVLKAL